MGLILNIETSGSVCSVALAKDGKLIDLKEEDKGYTHAEHLTLFIESLLKDQKTELDQLDAIAVSMGPGSYTGLRIGVATAKGLCYALNKPLIAVSTLESMVMNGREKAMENVIFCPVVDARRMEVYSGMYDRECKMIREIKAEIIDEHSFSDHIGKYKILFLGSGAEKCKQILGTKSNVFFDTDVHLSARGMISLSDKKFRAQQFENIAYFEPFYLKDFVSTSAKK